MIVEKSEIIITVWWWDEFVYISDVENKQNDDLENKKSQASVICMILPE